MSKKILIPKRVRRKSAESLTASADFEYPEHARWSGIIGVEGLLTGDGRFIEHDALNWSTPIPIRYVRSDVGAHDGAEVSGRILSITRLENGDIEASGDFDMGSEVGREAYRQVHLGYTTGVSMDLDDVSFEVRIAKEIVEEWETAPDEEGSIEVEEVEHETSADGRVIVWKGSPEDEVMAMTSARIRAATIVAIPAFNEARITAEPGEAVEVESDLAEDSEEISDDSVEALIASAITKEPPAEWFENPNLSAPTALQIDDDGRISGHLATWGACHIGNPLGSGVCVEAPQSATDYAYFHTGVLKSREGAMIAVGQITMNTGHANLKAGFKSAAAHYDHTGAAVADVRVGEDAHGIWVAGALRAGVTAEQIRTLRASPLSGDWRSVGGNMELVAALAVNVPGFPIPRTEGLVAAGGVSALVAAGMVVEQKSADAPATGLSTLDIAYLKRLAQSERKKDARELASRAFSYRNRRKVQNFVKGRA